MALDVLWVSDWCVASLTSETFLDAMFCDWLSSVVDEQEVRGLQRSAHLFLSFIEKRSQSVDAVIGQESVELHMLLFADEVDPHGVNSGLPSHFWSSRFQHIVELVPVLVEFADFCDSETMKIDQDQRSVSGRLGNRENRGDVVITNGCTVRLVEF